MPTTTWLLLCATWFVGGCATVIIAAEGTPAEHGAAREFTLQVDVLTISPQAARKLFPEQLEQRCIALSEIEAFILQQAVADELRGVARPKNTLIAGREYRYARYAELRSAGQPPCDVWVSRSWNPFGVTLSKSGKDDRITVSVCCEIGGKKQPLLQRECRDGEAILVFADSRANVDENRDCILLIPRRLGSDVP